MKRNEALKVITKVLKTWEDCKLTRKTSNEILTALEELGIITPPEIKIGEEKFRMSVYDDVYETLPVYAMEWEK